MADLRYQVFVSSTYLDLKEARQQVLHALLDLDCIPAGMELFSASSDEQFEYIKKEIDETDYYVLILGWRYGSLHSDGISYTEREFDYAVERGVPVLVFAHGDEGAVAVEHREPDVEKQKKLLAFRDRAMSGRLAKHWNVPDDLSIKVNKSLAREIKRNPRMGWIRANLGPSAETLAEIVTLQRENKRQSDIITELRSAFPRAEVPNLAPLSASSTFRYKFYDGHVWHEMQVSRTWQDIFVILAPSIVGRVAEESVGERLATAVCNIRGAQRQTTDQRDLERIRIQLLAQGLIAVYAGPSATQTHHIWWQLTEAGKAGMISLLSVKQ